MVTGDREKRIEQTDTSSGPGRKTYFHVLTLDEELNYLTKFKEDEIPPPQDPNDERARYIAAHVDQSSDPEARIPQDQLLFEGAIDRFTHVLNELYKPRKHKDERHFRHFYVELFSLARLVLQKGLLTVDEGRTLMKALEEDLKRLEGVRVKKERIGHLVRAAGWLSIPLILAYVGLSLVNPGRVYGYLTSLHIDPSTMASFVVLWLGSFVGVCLSFALRKPDLSLDDLAAKTEPDFLLPVARLAFAGTLTMLLVMLAMLHLVDITFGSFKLSEAVAPGHEMLAFVVGAICGISELLLPSRILGQTKFLATPQPTA